MRQRRRFYWPAEQVFYLPVCLPLGILIAYRFTLPRTVPVAVFTERATQLADRLRRERAAIEHRQQRLTSSASGENITAYAEEQHTLDDELRRIRLLPTEQVRGPDAIEYVRDALAPSVVPLEVTGERPMRTYERLAAVKRQYDPNNLFARNLNVRPMAMDAGLTCRRWPVPETSGHPSG